MSISDKSETYSSGRAGKSPPDVRLIHYNDVYHLDPYSSEPVGGLSRFMTVVKEYQDLTEPKPVTFFSGDAFNPSLESSITKGEHMVPVLNALGTDVACVGNHDLDFGVRQYRSLTAKCDFPWLLANILDPALGENIPIGNARRTVMLETTNGIKIGVIGLGEREWLATVNSLPPDLIYKSATETAKELVPQLRADGAEIVVCVSHMRENNDEKLARQTDRLIDIILGGHDHYYNHKIINGTHVLRSGTDFKQLSFIEARRNGTKWDFEIERRDIVSSIPPHKETVKLVDKLTSKLKKSLEKPIGWTAAPLDARFKTVRLRESNIGNFVCDLMRLHYSGDCAMMAAGTIRGDQVYPPGAIRIKDITNCFPFEDPVVVVNVTGQQLWDALENGVTLYPALEGRFPQVSNIKFRFDPSKPSGGRIVSASVGGDVLSATNTNPKKYKLVTRGYMARGKDGFRSLLIEQEGGEAEEVVSEENGILISMLLRQYFMSLRVMGQWKNWGPSLVRHWSIVAQDLCPTVTRTPHNTPVTPQKPDMKFWAGRVRAPSMGWKEWTAPQIRRRQMSIGPLDEETIDRGIEGEDSSSDDEADLENENAIVDDGMDDVDRSLQLARKVCAKWCRLAGVDAKVCDDMAEEEFEVDWTKAIAPRLEGRITMVGEVEDPEA